MVEAPGNDDIHVLVTNTTKKFNLEETKTKTATAASGAAFATPEATVVVAVVVRVPKALESGALISAIVFCVPKHPSKNAMDGSWQADRSE